MAMTHRLKNTYKKVFNFFDKLEDKIRAALSKRPLVYSFIGGVAIVLFWKGIWDIADQFDFLFGFTSVAISVTILMLTGLFASFFVGDVIIISGIKKEKKLIEKTEGEISGETTSLEDIKVELEKIEDKLEDIQKDSITEN